MKDGVGLGEEKAQRGRGEDTAEFLCGSTTEGANYRGQVLASDTTEEDHGLMSQRAKGTL